ncbi:MAG: DUF3048 domain-containing protein [Anaerolineae bacterium]|nr:DUF3048 domain-containing protein [Anaerolineae bacterium]
MSNKLRALILFMAVGLITSCSSPAAESGVVSQAAGLTPTVTEVAPTEAPTVAASDKLTTGPTVALPTAVTDNTPVPKPTATATQVKTGSPTPTKTKTVSPTATPQTYVIEQFDTLIDVALQYDITVEELMEANDLTEDDFLQIGQELIIPTSDQTVTEAVEEEEEADETSASAEEDNDTADVTTTNDDDVADVEDDTPSQSEAVAEAVPVPPTPTPVVVPGVSFAPAPELGSNINPLTGLPVDDPAKLTVRPLLVRIGNDPGARRAQKGLNNADMVYEEIAEWWVTRLTAIFYGDLPEVAGPIRSVRLVNVQLVPQYDGALLHSGGSDAVRWEVSQSAIGANLDEFFHPTPYFYHENENWETRLSAELGAARDYLTANGLEKSVSLPPFFFSKTIDGEPGEDVYIPYPGSSFTEWHYDAASGKYLRWINGVPMRDIYTGQVKASNVIVYFADHQRTDIVEDSTGATSVRVTMNGAGRAWFFRDGKLNQGYWQTDGTRPPYFTTEDGEPYPLKPGNTWVQIVPTTYTIGLNSADEASR